MKRTLFGLLVAAGLAATAALAADAATAKPPLGLPPVPIPADNLQTPEKIALGDKLFDDKRFSSTGQVACNTCHDPKKAFTDSPLRTSEGIAKAGKKLTGTRNAPTVVNAAYFEAHVLGRPLPEPRGPVAAPLRQSRRDGPQGPPADPEDRPVRPRLREGLRAGLRQEGSPGHHDGGPAGDRRLRADQGVRGLALRPLLLRRRPEGAHRRAEARLRPLREQGPLRVLPRDRADAGPLHRQPLPQHRGRDQRHPEGRARAGRGLPPGEGDPGRGRREGPRRQAHVGARALRHHPRLPGARGLQDLDAPQRGRHLSLHARRQPEDAQGGGRPLQQRRGDEEGRPGQRLPGLRHPAAGPHRAGGRRPRFVPGGAHEPRVRLAPERGAAWR